MNAVTSINPHLRTLRCPAPLHDLPGWLCWRFEHRDGNPKPLKVPIYPDGGRRHGRQGRPEDRERLTTFSAALQAAMRRGFDGVGFCPMPEWGITALDFDNCVRQGVIDPVVQDLVLGTYAEFSPSGKGVRAFIRGALGNHKSHGEPFGFEVFHSSGFVTLTGNHLPVTHLADCLDTVADASPALLAYCTERFGRSEPTAPATGDAGAPLGLSTAQLGECLEVLDPSMDRAGWLAVGMALHHETAASDEGLALWDAWSSTSSKYPGTDDMRYRWGGFGQGGQRPATARRLVRMANEAGARIDIAALEAADDFQPLPDQPVVGIPVTDKPARFTFQPAAEFTSRPPPAWIVKGVLPKAELVVLFGESGSGKSFIALDLGAAIARGVEWRGRRVRQGRVAYVAAEGAGGFRNRLVAYMTANQCGDAMGLFTVLHAAPNFLLKEDALDVSRALVTAGGADVVIVDTFAQVTPGANENAAEDMGLALSHCRGIHRATGAVVLLVHHAGKDASKGARGWSGLKAAADAELEVTRMPAGRMLRTSKQKDGEDGLEWGFDLEVVGIGQDEDGDPITSCVVREAELPAVQQVGRMTRKLGRWEKHVMAVLQEMAAVQTVGIERDAVLSQAVEREPRGNPEVRDTRRQHAGRALGTLLLDKDSGFYLDDEGCVCVA